jgi:hypothetical protein
MPESYDIGLVIASEAKQSRLFPRGHFWIASAYAQKRFGGLPARRSSRSERRRVVANAPRKRDQPPLTGGMVT